MADDPFEDVLNLEEQFYQEGYQQGYEDGVQAGRIEGRALGFEKGFEKFLESGRLYGKSIVWANRLPVIIPRESTSVSTSTVPEGAVVMTARGSRTTESSRHGAEQGPLHGGQDEDGEAAAAASGEARRSLPSLPDNPRLRKHINVLHALVETETLSTENTDEAVDDFDDRIRRAQGKARVIEKMTGEDAHRDGGAQRRHAQRA